MTSPSTDDEHVLASASGAADLNLFNFSIMQAFRMNAVQVHVQLRHSVSPVHCSIEDCEGW